MTPTPWDVADLLCLSRVFAYPDTLPASEDLARIGLPRTPQEAPQALTALQAEYVRLFVNSLPEVPCPPYGSFYLEKTLMGESTLRLKKLYASYGWQTDELPDHFAVELEFLAMLVALGEDAAVQEDINFLWDHLHLWAPAFLDRVADNDRSGFYRAASRYAKKIMGFTT